MGTLIESLRDSNDLKELGLKIITKLIESYEIQGIVHLKAHKQIKELKEMGIIDNWNKVDTKSRAYNYFFKGIEIEPFNLDKATRELMGLFAGKQGTGKDGNGRKYSYMLSEGKMKTYKALQEFHEEYPDVTKEEIIEATKKYFELKERDINGAYISSPKIVKFISGSDNKIYLYNYVGLIKEKDKGETLVAQNWIDSKFDV